MTSDAALARHTARNFVKRIWAWFSIAYAMAGYIALFIFARVFMTLPVEAGPGAAWWQILCVIGFIGLLLGGTWFNLIYPYKRIDRARNMTVRASTVAKTAASGAIPFGVAFIALIAIAVGLFQLEFETQFFLTMLGVFGLISAKSWIESRRDRAAQAHYDAHEAEWNTLAAAE